MKVAGALSELFATLEEKCLVVFEGIEQSGMHLLIVAWIVAWILARHL